MKVVYIEYGWWWYMGVYCSMYIDLFREFYIGVYLFLFIKLLNFCFF